MNDQRRSSPAIINTLSDGNNSANTPAITQFLCIANTHLSALHTRLEPLRGAI